MMEWSERLGEAFPNEKIEGRLTRTRLRAHRSDLGRGLVNVGKLEGQQFDGLFVALVELFGGRGT